MRIRINSFLFFLLLSCTICYAQEQHSGIIKDLPRINAEITKYFLSATKLKSETFPIPVSSFNYELNSEAKTLKERYWIGSEAQAETSISVELFWESPIQGKPSFSTYLELDQESFLAKLSDPFSASFAGGFKMAFPKQERKIVFLEGSERRSIIVILTPVIENSLWGVAICPRHFQEDASQYDVSTLKDTGYSLKKLRFAAKASARGKISTVGYPAYARAAILVSPELNPTSPFEDVSRVADPKVSVIYRPKGDQPLNEVVAGLGRAGIEASLNLTLASGSRRNFKFSSTLQVESVKLETEDSVIIDGIIHPVAGGDCVLIERADAREENYSEALK